MSLKSCLIATLWRPLPDHPRPAGVHPATLSFPIAIFPMNLVPSVENVLDSNPISWDADGNRLVSWEVNGGWQWVLYTKLRKACEDAYDPLMPNWPAMVEIDA
jgi:hypothetical protein